MCCTKFWGVSTRIFETLVLIEEKNGVVDINRYVLVSEVGTNVKS